MRKLKKFVHFFCDLRYNKSSRFYEPAMNLRQNIMFGKDGDGMAENRLIGDYPVIGIRPTIDGRRRTAQGS